MHDSLQRSIRPRTPLGPGYPLALACSPPLLILIVGVVVSRWFISLAGKGLSVSSSSLPCACCSDASRGWLSMTLFFILALAESGRRVATADRGPGVGRGRTRTGNTGCTQ